MARTTWKNARFRATGLYLGKSFFFLFPFLCVEVPGGGQEEEGGTRCHSYEFSPYCFEFLYFFHFSTLEYTKEDFNEII